MPPNVDAQITTIKTDKPVILDLSEQKIDDAWLKRFTTSGILGKDCPISTLYLDDNPIGDEGVIALANALKTNTSISRVGLTDLSGRLSSKGIQYFFQILPSNHSLIYFLNGKFFGDRAFSAQTVLPLLARNIVRFLQTFSHALQVVPRLTSINQASLAIIREYAMPSSLLDILQEALSGYDIARFLKISDLTLPASPLNSTQLITPENLGKILLDIYLIREHLRNKIPLKNVKDALKEEQDIFEQTIQDPKTELSKIQDLDAKALASFNPSRLLALARSLLRNLVYPDTARTDFFPSAAQRSDDGMALYRILHALNEIVEPQTSKAEHKLLSAPKKTL